VFRFLLWRILGMVALLAGLALLAWFLGGGPGRVLRGHADADGARLTAGDVSGLLGRCLIAAWRWAPAAGVAPLKLALLIAVILCLLIATVRGHARRRRRYVRLRLELYRTDHAQPEALVSMFEALHKRLLRRWWRRLLLGQPSVALEVHHAGTYPPAGRPPDSPPSHASWLAVTCPLGLRHVVQAALQGAYPNSSLLAAERELGIPPALLRLKKHGEFIKRIETAERFERELEPLTNRLLTVMDACGEPAVVQLAMTPTPALFEAFSKHLYKRHEARLSRERREHLFVRDRSMVEDAELRGGLEVQHRALFFLDLRVVATGRSTCEQIASEIRSVRAENRLVERGTRIRQDLLGLYTRRVQRGEGNPVPSFHKGVFASSELAALWQAPSSDYATVPFARSGLPFAPAPPAIMRPRESAGTLRDAYGPVSIHVEMRKQNVAVPGTVEQGKSSYLVATVAEDVRRDRCAVIVFDPKGDAAEAALSLVPTERTCTLLDFARPTCGFNPLAVDAPADVIADYVVAALKNLFTDADIRASSDRYLRNAIIAVLAHERGSSLWDAARLLSVGEEGYAYRSEVGAKVRTLPEFREISDFFTAELTAQLADARSTTTAKLDAPVNKLARLLNSPSIKRVLLNDSLSVDFDRVIAGGEVLIVKGALGAMGAGNTSVLMQLLIGMLDAALARQQDLLPAKDRIAVALKIDEAPLIVNRGFAETMALKRSAGLETVACWQTDAQWVDRDVRDQLDALFAHRVYFATASARDARAAVELTMAEFSDSVRPGIGRLSTLGRPDVRLHLPRHHAIASWSTPEGRQAPFVAQTIPLAIDRERIAFHAAQQHERGGRPRTDLSQPHWERRRRARGERAGASPDEQRDTTDLLVSATTEAEVRRPAADAPAAVPAALPATAADSYRELVELDRAHSVRRVNHVRESREIEADPLDLEVLGLLYALTHVLTTQIHRRLNPGRAATTTQRRLKRLADAGLVERFQFHRRDGGGVPMCYAIAAAGLRLLEERKPQALRSAGPVRGTPERSAGERADEQGRLLQARRDVHVAGWALALINALGGADLHVHGREQCVLHPPQRSVGERRLPMTLADLRLPGGRAPHDFLRTDGAGERVELERFESIRPDALIELPATGASTHGSEAIDLLIELDDRLPVGHAGAKLERYDHFLAGWSVHSRRYGRGDAMPLVVFVCRDRGRARECARAADAVLCACRAYAGEYPFDWQYPGREQIRFVAERDVHEGLLCAYGVPRLPPEVRIAAAHGDPRAGEATIETPALTRRAS
jgi:Replication-relaxation